MRNTVSFLLAGVLAASALAQQPSPTDSSAASAESVYPIECDEVASANSEDAGIDELALGTDVEIRVAVLESVAAEADEAPTPVADAAEEEACSYGLTGDWGGLRKQLEDKGITFGASLIFDLHQIASGGVDRDTIGHTYFDLTTTFDLAKLVGLSDAVLVADAYVINGRNPSDLVGDYQSFSSISADHVAQLGQLYYEQYLFDQKLRVKLGKADANVDFGAPDSSGEFVHSGAFYTPTMSELPTYQNPASAIAAFWQPNDRWSASLGVYDGATHAGINTGGRGPSTFFGDPDDLFVIGEASHRWTHGADDLAGRFTLGAWRHTGDFARFDGGTDDGTTGYYALADVELARVGEGDGQGTLAAFMQWGAADEDVADVDQHFAAGLSCSNICGCADDAVGFYVSSIGFSEGLGTSADDETAFECFYKWQARPWLVVKPDVQYITNPSGDATVEDAFVLTLRMQVDF